MSVYQLYLESGPRRQKTMVHVLALLGCIATGRTTEEALERTPAAIDAYLRFLQRHGEEVEPGAEFQIEVAEHITEGDWLGNGSPSVTYQPDLEPLSTEQLETYIRRHGWMHEELCELIGPMSPGELAAQPEQGRPIQKILEHVLESEYAYMYAFGRLEGMPALGSIVKKREGDLLSWIGRLRALEYERLRSLSEEERSEPFVHWKQTRSGRKVLRRMLEHQWEHLVEIKVRLGGPA